MTLLQTDFMGGKFTYNADTVPFFNNSFSVPRVQKRLWAWLSLITVILSKTL